MTFRNFVLGAWRHGVRKGSDTGVHGQDSQKILRYKRSIERSPGSLCGGPVQTSSLLSPTPSLPLRLSLVDMSRGLFSLLLLAVTLAVTAHATPLVQVRDNLIRIPMAKRFNLTGSGTLLARDQARARNLVARANAHLSNTPLSPDAVIGVSADNQAVDYVITVRASEDQS